MQPQIETGSRAFGADAQFTYVGHFRLVHLDRPDEQAIARRDEMVRDGSFFDEGCPICQSQKQRGGDIVFEPDLDWLDDPGASGEAEFAGVEPPGDGDAVAECETLEEEPLVWRRTYVDLSSLEGQPARTAVHAISTGISFCLLELIDDVTLLGQANRWAESLRHYCSCFARFSPALCGSDRLNYSEARNLGALTFQVRSYLGWFRECLPLLDGKCLDLDRICAGLLGALRRFDEDGDRAAG